MPRPSTRLIDRNDSPVRQRRQTSAFSAAVNADRVIPTTSTVYELLRVVHHSGAFIT